MKGTDNKTMKTGFTFKNAVKLTLVVLIVMLAAAFAMQPEKAYAARFFKMKASFANSDHTAVRIKWKPVKKMAAFRLFLYNGSGEYSMNLLKEVKLKKSRRSYTFRRLKKNTRYTVVLFGYSRKSAERKYRIAKSTSAITTGVSTVMSDWFGEDWTLFSKEYVEQDWWAIDTKLCTKASGIQIYKKENDGDWEKLVTLKRKNRKNDTFHYIDRDIEFGNTYSYKARAYARVKKNGKTRTLFGEFSREECCEIFNTSPVFNTENADPDSADEHARTATLKATADILNYDFVFHFGEGGTKAYFNGDLWAEVYADIAEDTEWEEKLESSCPVFIITEYKLGDGIWQEAKGDVTLRKGESITLKFEGETENDTADTTRWTEFMIPGCVYNESQIWGHIVFSNGYNGCSINDAGLEAARNKEKNEEES